MDVWDLIFLIVSLCWSYDVLSATHHEFTEPVQTDKGKIVGKKLHVKGLNLDAYYGIPFAKPPVGKYRFKHPQPPDPWTNIKQTVELPPACMQVFDTTFQNFTGADMWNPNTPRREDCLYLNVWVPRTTESKNKSVMVWIYGGSFSYGSISLDVYNGKYLAVENDVIVVSMQYRIGSLGFFAGSSPEAPGNCGLYDQLMALDWVQRNIHNFGGSPNDVTLFGESSGAASIGLHLLSPLSRSKFQRAILQSAGPTAPWATITREKAIGRGKILARKFNCERNSELEMLECMRKINGSEFPENDFVLDANVLQFPFVPIIDGVFLIEHPDISFKNGNFKRCPILLGANTNEGSYFLVYSTEAFNKSHSSPIERDQYQIEMKIQFRHFPQHPTEINNFVLDAIKFEYTPWSDPYDRFLLRDGVEAAVGDFNFACSTVDLAREYAFAGLKVYYYLFNHRSSVNPWGKWMGVMHGDEIMFMFGQPLDNNFEYETKEKRLSKKIMKYWTNFAKTGNPNKEPGETRDVDDWPIHTYKEREYIVLDTKFHEHNKKPTVEKGYKIKQCAFWREYVPTLMHTTGSQEK
ncbi:acetylcholinesterase-like isoform X2 [Ostrea edulis]|uniref:acetylcholinesterase-like isoform X2 n=1 Tax=Ostrea edulis TaxID=37623 RepID=UPI0024AEAE01|nr:acetylcholinesterase-like isoform X2 [Ostrea edulis]